MRKLILLNLLFSTSVVFAGPDFKMDQICKDFGDKIALAQSRGTPEWQGAYANIENHTPDEAYAILDKLKKEGKLRLGAYEPFKYFNSHSVNFSRYIFMYMVDQLASRAKIKDYKNKPVKQRLILLRNYFISMKRLKIKIILVVIIVIDFIKTITRWFQRWHQ